MIFLCRHFIKLMTRMRLACLVMLLSLSGLQAKVWSQQERLDLRSNDLNIVQVFEVLQKKTNLKFVFNHEHVQQYRVNLDIHDRTLEQILDRIFSDKPLKYEITPEHVIISKISRVREEVREPVKISGTVVDESGLPLPGVTVVLKGLTLGTSTDADGKFSLQVPEASISGQLVFSFIGMKSKEITLVKGKTDYKIILEEETQQLADVVVTGYFQKKKVTQTGSEVVVDGEELRKVGSLNLLQAISSFDPGVRTLENNEFGSDPNRMPEITVRGEKGFDLRGEADDSRTNPNAPLYIMDGIEVSAETVYDMDMNRVSSFSILKDAAATSLYGSRGANGVILITTVRPKAGEIQVTVNANYNISVPDLRSYNLMNAREKLEYEKRAGLYTDKHGNQEEQTRLDMKYNHILSEIERGVDTYWLSQPLKTSFNQRYSLYLEGGDEHFRYGINVKYDHDKGVMKGSGREKYGANVYFSYDLGNRLIARNDLMVDDVKGSDSPWGAFSRYAEMNPYERMYSPENGELIRKFNSNGTAILNPMVDATLPNESYQKYTQVRDNLQLDFRPTDHWYVKSNLAITKQINRNESFQSAQSVEFDSYQDVNEKGRYTVSNGTDLSLQGSISVSYNNNILDRLSVSAGVGSELLTGDSRSDGYTATGFLNDKLTYPSYAQGFAKNSKPSGFFDKSKSVGFFGNINLSWDNRYIAEASFRTDGSSRFGRDSRFAPFWAASVAWNVNREKFWTGSGFMKIRASVGSTGSTNFSADQAMTRFVFDSNSSYNGIYGGVISAYGNPSLKWQNVLKYNLGIDMSVWRDIISLNVDAFLERTENLLLDIDVAPSSGFTSYRENMGSLDTKGFEARLRLNLINDRLRDLDWNVTLSAAHEKDEIRKLSNAMKAMNKQATDLKQSEGKEVARMYEEGHSQHELKVVRSLGIDPQTGNEIYVRRDGSLTFEYDPNDKVSVGNTLPKLHGFFNSNLTWKGINLYLSFAYEYGAKQYNSTLAQKVEGARPEYNADRRVLYDRWNKPGDRAMFRRIDDQSPVYQSSRLVQKNNFLKLSSLSLSYDIPREILQKTFIERCKFTFSMTDLFRLSTIKEERGTSYPFARTASLGLNLTF